MVAKNTVKIEDPEVAKQLFKVLELIEDHDDVQKVYSNANFDDSVLES